MAKTKTFFTDANGIEIKFDARMHQISKGLVYVKWTKQEIEILKNLSPKISDALKEKRWGLVRQGLKEFQDSLPRKVKELTESKDQDPSESNCQRLAALLELRDIYIPKLVRKLSPIAREVVLTVENSQMMAALKAAGLAK